MNLSSSFSSDVPKSISSLRDTPAIIQLKQYISQALMCKEHYPDSQYYRLVVAAARFSLRQVNLSGLIGNSLHEEISQYIADNFVDVPDTIGQVVIYIRADRIASGIIVDHNIHNGMFTLTDDAVTISSIPDSLVTNFVEPSLASMNLYLDYMEKQIPSDASPKEA